MTDDELHDLMQRVERVEEMSKSHPWELLADRAKADMFKVQAAILSGGLEHEDYLRKTGEYQGMQRLLNLPVQMRRELDQERARYIEDSEEEDEE